MTEFDMIRNILIKQEELNISDSVAIKLIKEVCFGPDFKEGKDENKTARY